MNEKPILKTAVIGFLLPVILLWTAVKLTQARPADAAPPAAEEAQGGSLTVLFGTEVRKMDLQDYVLGVVLGEMPASFQPDALKAQAVAARTYTLKICADADRHGDNTICTNAACCQAYTDPADYLRSGETEAALERVRQAVRETDREVLVYEGELIVATYFSCAGDSTEDAVAVWGEDYPYLQAVSSAGEENTVFYSDSVVFSAEEFQQALGLRLEGTVDTWFGAVTHTNGGGVECLNICGIPFRGTTLRTLLGLRSTDFTVSVAQGNITVVTKGFGHRVGLSQYGAEAMAKAGNSYRQILAHYYTDTELVRYNDEIENKS